MATWSAKMLGYRASCTPVTKSESTFEEIDKHLASMVHIRRFIHVITDLQFTVFSCDPTIEEKDPLSYCGVNV